MRIFISHVHEEAKLALTLKDWIESTFGSSCDAFVSASPQDLPPGAKWLDRINQALRESTVFVVVCSPGSIGRPWISFETGCAWQRNLPVIPLCHSGLQVSDLPPPLGVFQALEVTSSSFCSEFLAAIARELQITPSPRIDERRMRQELADALRDLRPSAVRNEEDGPHVLTDTQRRILLLFVDADQVILDVNEVAKLLSLTKQSALLQFDLLERQGLVKLQSEVGAASFFRLTAKARALLAEQASI